MEGKDKSFSPTVGWMREQYDKMNQWLFGGSLGDCKLGIFTTGRGSQGSVLGWFKLTNNVYVDRYSRRMFINDVVYCRTIFVNRNNFVQICAPLIELNGNYTGTEEAFLTTLVHEMCHYYTYMEGYAPKQGHGREFKDIGQLVSIKSNGLFTIQRLATAEQMSEFVLSDEMKEKADKRKASRDSRSIALFQYTRGQVRLTITTSEKLRNLIVSSFETSGEMLIETSDPNVIATLNEMGYKQRQTAWRFWNVTGKPWLSILHKANKKVYNGDDETFEAAEAPKREPRLIFSIKTTNGVFEYDATSYSALVKAIKERFPNMSDQVIDKIVKNPSNYKLNEGRKRLSREEQYLYEIIDEYVQDRLDDSDEFIKITPDMNLGKYSPLEIA